MIELAGIPRASRLWGRIERCLNGELKKVRGTPVRARVAFVDDNGPKGGLATRCTLTVRLPRSPVLRVEEVADTRWAAFDRSFDRLKRRLEADRDRKRKRARYPKKYFAASRLHVSGLGPDVGEEAYR